MGVVYHVHEAFPQKPNLKHLIPAQTASAVPAVLFLPSVHFLPAPSGHPYLAQVPLSLILQFLLQSFSLSLTDLAAFPVASFSPPLGSFPAGSSDHPIRFQKIHPALLQKSFPPFHPEIFHCLPYSLQIFPECTPPYLLPLHSLQEEFRPAAPCSVQIHKHCMWTPASVPDTADAVRFCRSHPVLLFLQIHSCFPSSLSGIHIHKPQNVGTQPSSFLPFFFISLIYMQKIPEDHSSRILFSLHI